MPTFADLGALTLEDFAFTRAVVGGMDPDKAWLRYYANRNFDAGGKPVAPHGNEINAHARRLQDKIFNAAQCSADKNVRALVKTLSRELPQDTVLDAVKAEVHTSFNEWLESLDDPSMWSERELVEMFEEYQREHGDSAVRSRVQAFPEGADVTQDAGKSAGRVMQRSLAVSEKIRAINHLQTVFASRPLPDHSTSTWLAPALHLALAKHGVQTMADLTHFISERGRHWHRIVDKLGPGRAVRLLAWLDDHADSLGRIERDTLPWRPRPPMSSRTAPLQPPPAAAMLIEDPSTGVLSPCPALPWPTTAIVPFELLLVPEHLDGSTGLYRSNTPNHYGARNDYEAVRIWLSTFLNAAKLRTFEAYRREIERYYLWCMLEARVALSDAALPHALAYQAFLRNIPAAYIGVERVTREDPRWRPWRGQLNERSQAYALGVVSQFYNDAIRNAYVTGNPFASLRTPTFAERVMDTSRSLNDQDLRWVRDCLLELGEINSKDELSAAFARRTRLILQVALTTGMRLEEIATTSLLHARRAIVDGIEQEGEWLLEVCGKGKKKRYLPISDRVYRMILEHHADVEAQLRRAGESASERLKMLRARPPLVCALRAPVGHHTSLIDETAAMANDNLALGRAGLYRTLKTFFRAASRKPMQTAERHLQEVHTKMQSGRGGIEIVTLQALKAEEAATKRELQTWQRRSAISTHWLRHTFAKAVLAANPDDSGLKLTQQLLGHASINTTQLYIRQDESAKVRAVRKVNPLGM